MSKYKTYIQYINNGQVISKSVYTMPLESVTQEAVNIAMPLILRIHDQEPNKACVKITNNKTELLHIDYDGANL